MARSVTVGNGQMLVGLDGRGQVRDLYYPYVGESNHVSGASGSHVHRIGVQVTRDNKSEFSWLDDAGWSISVGGDEHTCVGSLFAEHDRLGVTIATRDTVHNEHNVFLREFTLTNTGSTDASIKLFVAQQFRIQESRRGDTGYFDPRVNAIVHYKGSVTLLVNAFLDGAQFSEYNIGIFGIEGKEGTWRDAEDGRLEGNPIEHGSVDSVIAVESSLEAGVSTTGYYWIIAADNIPAAHVLDELVLQETPAALIRSTDAYWSAWLEKHGRDLTSLPATLQTLYRRSLMIMRVHTDNNGGIIASSDTEMLHHGRDCYSYVWPRDGALIAHAFDQTGYRDVARQFFLFMRECQEPAGYLMHKYRTDGALGSSWHPWIIDGQARLPIQEDETASILFVLWKHFQRYKDVEFVESMYNSFIEPAANFMVDYIEPTTGLPSASFDLWEEKYGTSTYTAASVYAGLAAASKFAQLLGKAEPARTYGAVASRLKRAIDEHLWDEARGAYIKHVYHTEDGLQYDRTIDTSSLYGMLFFEVASHTDERLARMLQTVEQTLAVRGNAEGYMRYEGDNYYKQNDADTPNPWVICTLWVAQFYIAVATDKQGLQKALELLEWTASHATSSGVLAEQMHPDTRAQLSTAPLTWSHAEFVMACEAYMKKWHALQQN